MTTPAAATAITINIILDGTSRALTINPGDTLLRALRSEGIWSVRYGSDTGETGAAAVLVDGKLASADVLLAAQVDGHEVTTALSLNAHALGELHPIQAAFVATGAMQGGYSIGAMMLGTLALLKANPSPTEDDIRDMLGGILDRETAYVKPIEAINGIHYYF